MDGATDCGIVVRSPPVEAAAGFVALCTVG